MVVYPCSFNREAKDGGRRLTSKADWKESDEKSLCGFVRMRLGSWLQEGVFENKSGAPISPQEEADVRRREGRKTGRP